MLGYLLNAALIQVPVCVGDAQVPALAAAMREFLRTSSHTRRAQGIDTVQSILSIGEETA